LFRYHIRIQESFCGINLSTTDIFEDQKLTAKCFKIGELFSLNWSPRTLILALEFEKLRNHYKTTNFLSSLIFSYIILFDLS
jgi:hypothetical protein